MVLGGIGTLPTQIVQFLGWQYSMPPYIFGFVSQVFVYILLENHHYIVLLRLLRHTTQGKVLFLEKHGTQGKQIQVYVGGCQS